MAHVKANLAKLKTAEKIQFARQIVTEVYVKAHPGFFPFRFGGDFLAFVSGACSAAAATGAGKAAVSVIRIGAYAASAAATRLAWASV